MFGGKKKDSLDIIAESHRLNDQMINGDPEKKPNNKDSLKRVFYIFVGLFIASLLATLVYIILLKPEPAKPAPTPEPKPLISLLKIEGDEELKNLVYGSDYSVSTSGKNYLVSVNKVPKRLIYNGKEVYRGDDLVNSNLSKDGKHWALETVRDEVRSKRDENTKIVQNTNVRVSTIYINGQKWGEKDDSRLLAVTNSGAPVILSKTGKQTPSQYGEALSEEIIYFGATEKFKTSYGVVNFLMNSDGSNWLVTTANPSTKEAVDLFVNNTKKESLDARILKRLSIDDQGNYLVGFCKDNVNSTGVGVIGKDCQVSVNGKTRTSISGTVYLAQTLGSLETYAGVDRELKQSFIKNIRTDLALEHRKDIDDDPETMLGVYLNGRGDKFAVTSTRVINNRIKVSISINGEIIENKIFSASLFGFGVDENEATLFIYELPNKSLQTD
ncbi:MAG: hypothetical protein H6799_02335 [Candidatus Nomurabacteria bacterium]|nr:MAG: hypothetical protein H6799_02335 [Candidatus Nomurabacteria bacterium]HRV76363.1 hypothetical protein [Candidatus Saccharimonadales bacterium]